LKLSIRLKERISNIKYIAFSLFGNEPTYTSGAIANAISAKDFYPDWRPVFYVANDVNEGVIEALQDTESLIIPSESSHSLNPRMWRFAAALLEDAEFTIFRDTDSRFSRRETYAVNNWIDSGRQLHIIRDHPHHYYPIMAGMWGVKSTKAIKESITRVLESAKGTSKPEDQKLLAEIIYPKFRDDSFVNDAFFSREKSHPMIPREPDGSFIGERIDALGECSQEHRELLIRYEKSPLQKLRLKYFDLLRELIYRSTEMQLYVLLKSGKTEKI
jgi:hypothetical protein